MYFPNIYGGPEATADSGRGPNEAYSFFYGLVQNENWTAESGNAADNLKGIAVAIPAGGKITHSIRTDPDHNFLMKWVKFSAYEISQGTYLWYDQPGGWYYNYGDYQLAIGTPLVDKIKVSMWYDPESRFLRGGSNTDFLSGSSDSLRPIELNVLQGYEYGMGQVQQDTIIPLDSNIIFEFENTHDATLYIAGAVYGYKIREIAA